MKRIILFSLLVFGSLFTHQLMSQNKDAEISELVNQIIMARKASNDLLPKYSWTSRTEIVKSREILNIMIEKNQYDPQGQLVQKILNQQSAKMPKAFLIKEIAESEKENMEKFLFGLRDFLKKYSQANGKNVMGLTSEAQDMLLKYDYPGNVRELENIIERAVVIAREDLVALEDLPFRDADEHCTPGLKSDAGILRQSIEELERQMIMAAMEKAGDHQTKAAEALGLSERMLRYKLKKYGLKE